MDRDNLKKVYTSVILPSVEYCSEIYHSLIPAYISDKLESVHRRAIRIIFGYGVDFEALVADGVVCTLEERRQKACARFANRSMVNPKFGPRWFPVNRTERTVRDGTRRHFVEGPYKTERDKNNPIQFMLRLLNRLSSD